MPANEPFNAACDRAAPCILYRVYLYKHPESSNTSHESPAAVKQETGRECTQRLEGDPGWAKAKTSGYHKLRDSKLGARL